jgi:hypothetical protein
MAKTKLQEFLTPKRTLALQNKKGTITNQYRLGHYSLGFQSLLYLEFATEAEENGIQNFVNRISNNDPKACLKGIYLLIEDKEDFPLFEDFLKFMEKFDAPIHEIQILLMKVINDSIPRFGKKKAYIPLTHMIFLMIAAGLLFMM